MKTGTLTITEPETRTNLGPLDAGPAEDWVHLRRMNPDGTPSDWSLCGEYRRGVPIIHGCPGPRCPDCARIQG